MNKRKFYAALTYHGRSRFCAGAGTNPGGSRVRYERAGN